MKNNNFLIALALCLGLSSTVSFCAQAPRSNTPSLITNPNAAVSTFWSRAQEGTRKFINKHTPDLSRFVPDVSTWTYKRSVAILSTALYGLYSYGPTAILKFVVDTLSTMYGAASVRNALLALVAAVVGTTVMADYALENQRSR